MIEVRILTQSGTVHRAYVEGGVRYTPEGDNIDASDYQVFSLDEWERGLLSGDLKATPCKRCFSGVRMGEGTLRVREGDNSGEATNGEMDGPEA